MIIRTRKIEVQGLEVEVVRKNIRHLRLTVYPPDGRVRLSVPLRLAEADVRRAVSSKLAWIRKQREALARRPAPPPRRELVSGESLYVHGQHYSLAVVEQDGPAAVRLSDDRTLELRVPPGTDRQRREALLQRWYRQRLAELVPALIAQWEPELGVRVAEWRIRRMKTRWGTCNIKARRIWLNLELALKPLPCLEYIVVHEMVHLLERRHNERFKALMDRFLPQWRLLRDRLNHVPQAEDSGLAPFGG